jgi:hypothetical protein
MTTIPFNPTVCTKINPTVPSAYWLNILISSSGNKILLFDSFGHKVYMSEDSGENWNIINEDYYSYNPNPVMSDDGMKIIIPTYSGYPYNYPYYSNDGGVSFSRLSVPVIPGDGGFRPDSRYHFMQVSISGDGNTITANFVDDSGWNDEQDCKSTNEGNTWIQIYPYPEHKVQVGATFIKTSYLGNTMIATNKQKLYASFSKDTGNTWTTTPCYYPSSSCISADGEIIVFLSGSSTYLTPIVTIDGGSNWVEKTLSLVYNYPTSLLMDNSGSTIINYPITVSGNRYISYDHCDTWDLIEGSYGLRTAETLSGNGNYYVFASGSSIYTCTIGTLDNIKSVSGVLFKYVKALSGIPHSSLKGISGVEN